MKKKLFNTFKPLLDLTARKKSFQGLYSALYHLGLYGMNYGVSGDIQTNGELKLLHHLKSRINRRDPVLFDVGANLGEYSNLLGSIFGPSSQIYAFEPSAATYVELKKRLMHSNIQPVNVGLSDATQELKLFINKDHSSMASLYQREIKNVSMNEFEVVSLKTLDEFCNEQGIQKIDFLKIDVEGHEYKVLQGASKMIKNKAIRFIQFEFGGCNIESRVFLKNFWDLLKDDFKLYRIVSDGVYPITEYNETLEIFTYTNFFAELK
jgi:FkbM family methyltransferase